MRKIRTQQFRFVPGQNYGTPKEVWHFESAAGSSLKDTVGTFLALHAEVLGIEGELKTLRVRRHIESLGAHHVILEQKFRGRRIHRAYVTLHVRRGGGVYLVKNRAVPRELLARAKDGSVTAERALALARRAVPHANGKLSIIGKPESLWYPLQRLIHPVWRVRVHRTHPRSEWIVYVSAETGRVLEKQDNLASATGRARVFAPNPMAGAPDFRPLQAGKLHHPPDNAYRVVRITGLRNTGKLDGRAVSTVLTKHRVHCPNFDFRRAHTDAGFEEISAYYHVSAGLSRLEQLGYTGRLGIFHYRLRIDARGTREDNSWYSPGQRTLTFGVGDIDDAEDGETVLHEFGHAIQDAICPDFGQSAEAAAMGEGFGDYFAASYFAEAKPKGYRLAVMTWDGARIEDREVARLTATNPTAAVELARARPPCVRRLDSPLTYESFDHSAKADEHENGEIWSATLWEIREALGRDTADRIIVDSHFQLDGFTTFARGARAVLDAERNLHEGRRLGTLRRIFRRRGIGPIE